MRCLVKIESHNTLWRQAKRRNPLIKQWRQLAATSAAALIIPHTHPHRINVSRFQHPIPHIPQHRTAAHRRTNSMAKPATFCLLSVMRSAALPQRFSTAPSWRTTQVVTPVTPVLQRPRRRNKTVERRSHAFKCATSFRIWKPISSVTSIHRK